MTSALATERAAWTDFESRLRAYVRKRVDPAAADDVHGEVMLRLVQHKAELQAAQEPVAWMLRVAANAIADHYRRREVEARKLAEMQSEAGPGEVYSDEHRESAAGELARCLVPLINDLPAPYGEALLMTEIEGVAQNVAAKRIGLSHSGMKARVQRGRAKLKEALLRCCDVEVNRHGAVLGYERREPGAGCTGSCD